MSEYRRESRASPGLAQDPDAIWRARKLAGLTQEQLAEKTGIAASKISEIETGRLSASPAKLASLAAALGVPVGQLENRDDGRVEPGDVEAEQELLRQLVGMYPLVAARALADALVWLPADPPGHDPAAITWLRQRAGLSQEALAAACGVSVKRIRSLEAGGTAADDELIVKLARALGCPPSMVERKRRTRVHKPKRWRPDVQPERAAGPPTAGPSPPAPMVPASEHAVLAPEPPASAAVRPEPSPPDPPPLGRLLNRFPAGYAGHCGRCGDRINRGDVIEVYESGTVYGPCCAQPYEEADADVSDG